MKKSNFNKVMFGFAGVGLVSLLAWILINSKSAEPNLIIVSKGLVAAERDLTDWENENINYYHTDQTDAGTFCNDNVVIDLNGVSEEDGNKVRDWLEKNSKFICFKDSYKYIEKSHLITDPNYITAIEAEPNKREITFQELIDKTNVFFTLSSTKFENRGYEGYLNFFKPSSSEVRFVYDFGLVGEGRYSIPFFRSIRAEVRKKLNDTLFEEKDIKLDFVKVTYNGNEAIAFRVFAEKTGTVFKQYYNFSTDPGKPITYKLL